MSKSRQSRRHRDRHEVTTLPGVPPPVQPARPIATHLFVAVLVVAAAVRVVHLATTSADPFFAVRIGDEQHYHLWAKEIVASGPIRQAAFFSAPLYAYLLAANYALGLESVVWARAVNALLGIACVVLTWAAARRLMTQMWAALPAALVAFSLPSILYETFADKTILTLFCTVLALYCILRARTTADWCLAGLASAVGALSHPLLLVLTASAAVHIVVCCRSRRALAALLLGTAAGLAPAVIHNFLASGEFILISSNGGMNLYLGNHAGNATGAYTRPSFALSELSHEEADFAREASRISRRALSPGQVSRFWTARALSDMAAAPALSLRRILNRLRWTIGDQELIDSRSPAFTRARSPVLRLPLPGFGLVAVLGLLGGAVLARKREYWGMILFLILYWVALSCFFVFGRLRFPLLAPLALLAGGGVAQLSSWIAARDRRTLSAGLIIPFSALVYIGPRAGTGDAFTDHFNLATRLYQEGSFVAAAAEYEAALQARPLPLVQYYLAEALEQSGRSKEASLHFDLALTGARQQGTEALVYLGLARRMSDLGGKESAREILTLGIRVHPESADLHTNLGTLEAQLGHLAQARQHWEEAVALDPLAAIATANLALLARQEGNIAVAETFARRFLKMTKEGEYQQLRQQVRAILPGR